MSKAAIDALQWVAGIRAFYQRGVPPCVFYGSVVEGAIMPRRA